MTRSQAPDAVVTFVLLVELVNDPDWPGCAGEKRWDPERQKMVYHDCEKCVYCRAEAYIRKLEQST